MSDLVQTRAMRLMVIPATAGTYYPTGVTLGLSGSTLVVSTATVTTTQANSFFADPLATTSPAPKRNAILRKIIVHTAGAGSTITLEGHNGTAILPAFVGTAAGAIFDVEHSGLPLNRGFRVTTVSATAPLVMLLWEIDGNQ